MQSSPLIRAALLMALAIPTPNLIGPAHAQDPITELPIIPEIGASAGDPASAGHHSREADVGSSAQGGASLPNATDAASKDQGSTTRVQIEAEIARLEAEIAELGRLKLWQSRLIEAAGSDPANARLQRRGANECLTGPLARVCAHLIGMFQRTGEARQ